MDIGFPISSGGGSSYTEVANFASLPTASTVSGITYLVIATTGVIFINRKLAGLYKSNGTTWDYLGDVTSYVNTVGGTAGQVLAKIDSTDFNTQWIDAPSSTNHQLNQLIGVI
jgi:glycopeptide antibiotics resistance protein